MSWVSDMQAIHDDACGLMQLDVVCAGDLGDLVGQSLMGSQLASNIISGVQQVLDQVAKAPRRRPLLCASCPSPILPRGEFWICLAHPANETSMRCLTLAVCGACGKTRDEARARGMDAMRRIWPSARPIEIHHEAGNA